MRDRASTLKPELEPDPDCPDLLFGLSGRFWPIRRPLFQGTFAKPTRVGIVVCMIASSIPASLRADIYG
jgi:hypothetical protein